MSLTMSKEIDNIYTMLNHQKSMCKSFKDFFDSIAKKWNIIIIGGSLRDALEGNYKPRDIDIIIDDCNLYGFDDLLFKYNVHYKKNRFEGYKLFFDNVEVDIWSIFKHYAFENKYYTQSIENIVETTFLNYDSIAFYYQEEKLYKKHYDNCLSTKQIELIGSDEYIDNNPTPNINIARMLKIKRDTGYDLSSKATNYIQKYYDECVEKQINIKDALNRGHWYHYKKEIDEYMLELLNNILQEV